jgi:threonine dehydrogenase-like Zn-dependent dehydrogenase/SAM-dependent methyltransferase
VSAILASGTWAGIGQAELLALVRDPVDATARDVLGRLGVGAGWRCRVLGADAARTARWIAARTGDAELRAAAAANCTAHRPTRAGGGVAAGGARAAAAAPGRYDLAYVRLTASHWPDPAAGLAAVAEALRPGGWLVAADLDWAAAHPVPGPHADGLAAGLAAVRELLGLAGEYDPTAGAALPGLLAAAGLTAVAHDYRSQVVTGPRPGRRGSRHVRPAARPRPRHRRDGRGRRGVGRRPGRRGRTPRRRPRLGATPGRSGPGRPYRDRSRAMTTATEQTPARTSLAATMTAARAHAGRAEMTFEQVPVPDIEAGEVLVEVRAVGVSRGLVSVLVFTDMIKLLPATVGHEIAGTIAAVGPGVDGLAVGDRVHVYPPLGCGACAGCARGQQSECPEFAMIGYALFQPAGLRRYERYHHGGMAEYVRVPAGNVDPLPDTVSYDAGAKLTTAAVSWRAVATARGAGGPAGGTLIVTGAAGANGSIAVAAAAMHGFDRVVAVANRRAGLDRLAERYPQVAATIATKELPEKWQRTGGLTAALSEAAPDGAQALVDFTPLGGDIPQQAIKALARNARAVLVAGNPASIQVDYLDIMARGRTLTTAQDPSRDDVRTVAAAVGDGRLALDPLVTHRFALADLNTAISTVLGRKGQPVLVVVHPRETPADGTPTHGERSSA